MRSLGADEVVDYLQEDFTKNGQTYDVVFDAVGKHSFRRCRRSLKPGGVYISTDLGFMWHVPPLALLTRWIGDKRVTIPIPSTRKRTSSSSRSSIEAGKYRAVIDRRYRLEDVVEATKYVETGQKTGNVVLTLNEAGRGVPREGGRPRALRAAGGPGAARGRAARAERRRASRPRARDHGEPDGLPRPRRPKQVFWRFIAGFLRPKQQILGTEFAGEVEAVGSAVTGFRPGDRVFGWGWSAGAHAEYLCMRESGRVVHMPEGMPFEEAAAICDGAYQGLSALRAGNVGEGTRLVVYGASGSLGTAAVQLARHLGAHVTAVCNTKNLELVRSLGADEVVDYLREDFTKNGQVYDVVIDAVGKYAYWKCRRSLRPGRHLRRDRPAAQPRPPVLDEVVRLAEGRVPGRVPHA